MAVGKYVATIPSTKSHDDRIRYTPIALAGDTLWLTGDFNLQEQEIVKGQEGPQEEDGRSLRPQGLVRHQGKRMQSNRLIE